MTAWQNELTATVNELQTCICMETARLLGAVWSKGYFPTFNVNVEFHIPRKPPMNF